MDNKNSKYLLIAGVSCFIILATTISVAAYLVVNNKSSGKKAIDMQREVIKKEDDRRVNVHEIPKYEINKETNLPNLGINPDKELEDFSDYKYSILEKQVLNKLSNYDFKGASAIINTEFSKYNLRTSNEYLKNEDFYLDVNNLAYFEDRLKPNSKEVMQSVKESKDERSLLFGLMRLNFEDWSKVVKSNDAYVPATEDRLDVISIEDVSNSLDGHILDEINKYSSSYDSIKKISFKDYNSEYEAYFTNNKGDISFITIKTNDDRKKTVNQWREIFRDMSNNLKDKEPSNKTTSEADLLELQSDDLKNSMLKELEKEDLSPEEKSEKTEEINNIADYELKEFTN